MKRTSSKRYPERTCISCGKKALKWELLRIVRLPDGRVTFDREGKAPGRGAYVCKNKDCIRKLKLKKLRKALRLPESAEIDIQAIKKELEEAVE